MDGSLHFISILGKSFSSSDSPSEFFLSLCAPFFYSRGRLLFSPRWNTLCLFPGKSPHYFVTSHRYLIRSDLLDYQDIPTHSLKIEYMIFAFFFYLYPISQLVLTVFVTLMLLVLENKEGCLKLLKSALVISGSMGIMVPSRRGILVNWVARPNKG